MAKQKQAKIKPAEAVKVLANEVNQSKQVIHQMTQDLMQTRAFLTEVGTVLEHYISFKDDKESFTNHMKKLAEESKNDNQGNESTDGKDSSHDKSHEGVGTEGVRA